MTEPWAFGALPMFGFDLIMADPPWEFRLWSEEGEAKSPQAQYQTMSPEAIAALPVGFLASGTCVLFLWCTWPMLLGGSNAQEPRAAADASFSPVGAVIKAWGFRYVTGGAWHKKTVHGRTAFGTGYRARSACEPFLLAVSGNPDTSRAERNLIEGLAREHSRKPEAAYAWCERYLPGARRLDLFSRETRPGWTAWGHEAGKFDARAA